MQFINDVTYDKWIYKYTLNLRLRVMQLYNKIMLIDIKRLSGQTKR